MAKQAPHPDPAWLVLLFSLPRAQASGRVDLWRRLKKSGALPLASGGHVLPHSQDNREHFEWLAEGVRQYEGEASVLTVRSIDGLPFNELKAKFVAATDADYAALIEEAEVLKIDPKARQAGIARLRRRLQEIAANDHFGGTMRSQAKQAVQTLAGHFKTRSTGRSSTKPVAKSKFTNRLWVTRPRPGIDRAASAWLIVNYIDAKAGFKFAKDPASFPKAVPFDMYRAGGFGHRGDSCTFETLLQEFKLKGRALQALAEMVHDADLKDEKYGRTEAITIQQILKGWAAAGTPDDELLRKGVDLIDGLYRSIA